MDDNVEVGPETVDQELADARRALAAIQIPLECIANLSFLAHHALKETKQAETYLLSLDDQVRRITEVIAAFSRAHPCSHTRK